MLGEGSHQWVYGTSSRITFNIDQSVNVNVICTIREAAWECFGGICCERKIEIQR